MNDFIDIFQELYYDIWQYIGIAITIMESILSFNQYLANYKKRENKLIKHFSYFYSFI